MKRSEKKKIQYSIIAIIVLVILTFFISIPLKTKTDIVMSQKIQSVLENYSEDTYTLSQPIILQNTISTIGSFYSVNTRFNETLYAGIIRIMGIAGPVPAVFLYEDDLAHFIGIVDLDSDNSDTSIQGITNNQRTYWENIITEAIVKYISEEDDTQ